RRLGGQPGDLLVETAGVAGAVPCPWHRRHDHAVDLTADPWCVGFEEHHDFTEVQGPPPASSLTGVVTARPTAAHPAPRRRLRGRPDMSDQAHRPVELLLELNLLDHRLLDPKQPPPYSS